MSLALQSRQAIRPYPPRGEWALNGVVVLFLLIIIEFGSLPNVTTITWALADLVAIIALALNFPAYAPVLARLKLYLALPALATMSMIWSLTPMSSFYHGVQLFMNGIVALVLCRNVDMKRFLVVLFLFGVIGQLFALAYFGMGMGFGDDGFFGPFRHKNELGMYSTVQLFTCATLFLSGKWRWAVAPSIAVAFFLLFISRSGTSISLTLVFICFLPTVFVLRRGMTPSGVLLGLGTALVALAVLWITVSDFNVVDTILTALGKDSKLSGRTILWDFGVESIEKNPVLGLGYFAYWDSFETTSTYLVYVLEQQLQAFHNVYIEVTVALGFVGLSVFLSGLAQQILRAVLAFARDKSGLALFPLLFTFWICMLNGSEYPLFWNSLLQFLLGYIAAWTAMRTMESDEQGAKS